MSEKITITRQKITPEIAAQLLKTNIERNRTISVGRVAMYEHDMLSGKWTENGETIKIDNEGRLIDGQHRLKAIERSGVTLWLWVAQGVTPESFENIDVGLSRTPRQIFNLSNDAIKRHKTASAIPAFAFRVFTSRSKATQAQMTEFVEQNRETLEWLYGAIKYADVASAFYLTTAIAMHLYGVPDKEINGFVSGAVKADFDPTKDAYVFRHCVQAENIRKTKLRTFTLKNLQEIEKCAYSYTNNLQKLTAREDPYPMKMDSKYKLVKA